MPTIRHPALKFYFSLSELNLDFIFLSAGPRLSLVASRPPLFDHGVTTNTYPWDRLLSPFSATLDPVSSSAGLFFLLFFHIGCQNLRWFVLPWDVMHQNKLCAAAAFKDTADHLKPLCTLSHTHAHVHAQGHRIMNRAHCELWKRSTYSSACVTLDVFSNVYNLSLRS